eukprot:gene24455-10055_t
MRGYDDLGPRFLGTDGRWIQDAVPMPIAATQLLMCDGSITEIKSTNLGPRFLGTDGRWIQDAVPMPIAATQSQPLTTSRTFTARLPGTGKPIRPVSAVISYNDVSPAVTAEYIRGTMIPQHQYFVKASVSPYAEDPRGQKSKKSSSARSKSTGRYTGRYNEFGYYNLDDTQPRGTTSLNKSYDNSAQRSNGGYNEFGYYTERPPASSNKKKSSILSTYHDNKPYDNQTVNKYAEAIIGGDGDPEEYQEDFYLDTSALTTNGEDGDTQEYQEDLYPDTPAMTTNGGFTCGYRRREEAVLGGNAESEEYQEDFYPDTSALTTNDTYGHPGPQIASAMSNEAYGVRVDPVRQSTMAEQYSQRVNAANFNLTKKDLARTMYTDLGENSVAGSANVRLVGGRWRKMPRPVDGDVLWTDYYGPCALSTSSPPTRKPDPAPVTAPFVTYSLPHQDCCSSELSCLLIFLSQMALPFKSSRLEIETGPAPELETIVSPTCLQHLQTKRLRRLTSTSHFTLLGISSKTRQSSLLLNDLKAELGKRRRQLDCDVEQFLDDSELDLYI